MEGWTLVEAYSLYARSWPRFDAKFGVPEVCKAMESDGMIASSHNRAATTVCYA
jgi:hypothetical protein